MTFKGFKSAWSPAAKFHNSCAPKSGWGGKHRDKHDDDDHGRKIGHWKDHKAWPHTDHDHDHGKAAWKWHHPHHHDRDPCPPKNAAPVITSPATFAIDENQTGVGTVVATDANMDAVVYAITGGSDAALFEIDPTLGTLVFKTAPDFERPADAGADNFYDITVSASDGTAVTTQDVQVTVNDVAENQAPQITAFTDFVRGQPVPIDISSGTADAGIRVGEDGQVGFIAAFDPDGDTLIYSITGGSDADLFEIDQAGRIFALDSVTPFGDEDTDNLYEFVLTVDDGNGGLAALNMEYFVLSGA